MNKNKPGLELKYNVSITRFKVEEKWTKARRGLITINLEFAFTNLYILFHTLVVNFINLLLICKKLFR